MRKNPLFAAITIALLATGCNQPGTQGQQGTPAGSSPAKAVAPAPTAENSVAIVNGRGISKAAVENLKSEMAQRRGGNNISDDRIIDELIKREVLRQEAEQSQLLKDPKFAARMENAERMILSQIAAENFTGTVQVTDEEVKKEYDEQVGKMTLTEFKARHILVDSEQAAKDAIAKLKKGEKFADLAKKISKDQGSKVNGGDLGWFPAQQMVPPFSQAVVALKNGEMTQTPVQTQFGWHVILREDSRDQPPPPFDAVKDQVKMLLQTQKLQQHIADLVAKAKVEDLRPKTPAAAAPSQPNLEAGKPQPAPGGEPPKPVQPAQPSTPPPAKPAEPARPAQ